MGNDVTLVVTGRIRGGASDNVMTKLRREFENLEAAKRDEAGVSPAMAATTAQEIIVNIYKTCLVYNKREIYHNIPQDVVIDTEVMIYDKEGGQGKRYKIKEIYEDYFVIDEDIEDDDCFVFGYMVNDLNGLDKSYIYTLNVCATQELHRRIEVQDKRIKDKVWKTII
jgi:hypothetical protein